LRGRADLDPAVQSVTAAIAPLSHHSLPVLVVACVVGALERLQLFPGSRMMNSKSRLACSVMVSFGLLSGAALAGDATTGVGGAVGGASGAAIGNKVGGKTGTVVGGAVGGAVGAGVGTSGKAKTGAIVGGAAGGAAGAAVGQKVGGSSGAVAGAAIGGATGALIGKKLSGGGSSGGQDVKATAPQTVAAPASAGEPARFREDGSGDRCRKWKDHPGKGYAKGHAKKGC
jgi:hypothetical protein